jgi:hypothetical protein
MGPPPPAIDPSMFFDPAEIEREKRRHERLQQAQAERNEQRALRAREEAEVRRIREEQFARELFGGQG